MPVLLRYLMRFMVKLYCHWESCNESVSISTQLFEKMLFLKLLQ